MNNSERSKGKVIKAGIGYTIANYLIKGLVFITIPIFTRLLSTEDYGEYSTYIAYESVLSSIIGMALYMSLKNAKYKFKAKYHSYISSILLLNIVSLVAWEIIGFVFYPLFGNALGMDRMTVFILIVHCCCTSLLSTYNIYLSLSFSYERYILIAAINAIANVVLSVLLIMKVFSENKYYGRIIGTVAPLVIIGVVIVFRFWHKEKPHVNRTYWVYGLKYSLPLIPHAVSQVILNQFDRIMIKNMVGPSEAGIYSFAYNIYMIVEVTKISLDNVWGAWFYERYHCGDYITIKKRSSSYIYGFFTFTVALMLISPELIRFVGTANYYDAKYLSIPICAAGFYSFLYTIPAQVEYYHEKTKYISIGTAIAALVNIILNTICIRQFGYFAAAYTTELTYFLYFFIHFFVAKKIATVNLFEKKAIIISSIGCFVFSILGVIFVDAFLVRVILFAMVTVTGLKVVNSSGFIREFLQAKKHNSEV